MKNIKLSAGQYINPGRILGVSIIQSQKGEMKWFVTIETDVLITGKEGKEETLKKFYEVADYAAGEQMLINAGLI
jgi:hypothetical protein